MILKDKQPTIVITGASAGIGLALAQKMADDGYDVIGIARTQENLDTLKAHAPDKITVIKADVTIPEDRDNIKAEVANRKAPIILVHCAHAKRPISLLQNLQVEDFRHHLETNVEAPLFLTQALLPHLKGGRVLHLSSALAHFPLPGLATFCIAKDALHMLYRCWPNEINIQDIAFGSVIPGVVDTKTQETLREASPKDLPIVDAFRQYKEKGELIPPKRVANFLSYILLKTDNEEFSETEWNILDRYHHPLWLTPGADVKYTRLVE